jgi:hypothetical protein
MRKYKQYQVGIHLIRSENTEERTEQVLVLGILSFRSTTMGRHQNEKERERPLGRWECVFLNTFVCA